MPAKKAASTAVAKPTYAIMAAESIKALNDRTGSSVQAITKHLVAQYHTDINRPALLKALKKGVEAGDLVQIRASYKLNKKAPVPKAKKPVPAKKKVPAKRETATARKAAAAKKAATKPKKAISKRTTKTSTAKRSFTTSTTKKAAPKKPAAKKGATSKKKTTRK